MTWNRIVSSSLGEIWRYLEGRIIGICDWMWMVKEEERRRKILKLEI